MTVDHVGRIALHAIPIVTMGVSGTAKLTGATTDEFEEWGFPPWIPYVTGATEIASAAMLAAPRTSPVGGLLAGAVLAGAIVTHLVHREYARVLFPAATGAAVAASVWKRRNRRLPLHEPARSGPPARMRPEDRASDR